MVFLYLIDYAARFLRPVSIVAKVGQFGVAVIQSVYPERDHAPAPGPPPGRLGSPDRIVVNVGAPGVVLAVDLAGLVEQARRANGIIEFVPQVGDFLAVDEPLFRLYGGAGTIDDRLLREAVVLGVERTMEQDPTFAFRILVDIAIKALSAAINDPTTAVLAIDQLHRLLRLVGLRDLRGEELRDEAGELRLVFRTPNWEDYVHLACTEIRHCGAGSIQVMRRMRSMLENLMQTLPPHRHAELRQQLELLDRTVDGHYAFPEDRALAHIADPQGLGGSLGVQPVRETPAAEGGTTRRLALTWSNAEKRHRAQSMNWRNIGGVGVRPVRLGAAGMAVLAACMLTGVASPARAQDIEPRAYSNAPVGVNFLIAGYVYTRGGLSFDPAVPITDANLDTSNAVLAYATVLDLWGMSGKFDAIVPYTWLSGTAKYQGEPVERIVNGFARPAFRLSIQSLRGAGAHAEGIRRLGAGPDHRRQPAGVAARGPVRFEQARQHRHQPLVVQAGARDFQSRRSVDAGIPGGGHVLHRQRRFLRGQDAVAGPALLAAGAPDLRFSLRHLGFGRWHVLRRRPHDRRWRAEQRPAAELACRGDAGAPGGPR